MKQMRRPNHHLPFISLHGKSLIVGLYLFAALAWSVGSYAQYAIPVFQEMYSPLAQVLSALVIAFLLALSCLRFLNPRWLQSQADGITHAHRLALIIAIAAPIIPGVAMTLLVLLVGTHLPWSLLDLRPLMALVRALTVAFVLLLPAYLRILLLGGVLPAAERLTFDRSIRTVFPTTLPMRPLAPRAPPTLFVSSG